MKKRLLSVIVALITVVGVLPLSGITAYAAPTQYDIYIGNVQVTSDNMSDVLGDGTVSYDDSTKKLTLHNFTARNTYHTINYYEYTTEFYIDDDDKIDQDVALYLGTDVKVLEIKGTNKIWNAADINIFADGNLTIEGTGTLNILNTDTSNKPNAVSIVSDLGSDLRIESGIIDVSNGIWTRILTVRGGELCAYNTHASENYAINAYEINVRGGCLFARTTHANTDAITLLQGKIGLYGGIMSSVSLGGRAFTNSINSRYAEVLVNGGVLTYYANKESHVFYTWNVDKDKFEIYTGSRYNSMGVWDESNLLQKNNCVEIFKVPGEIYFIAPEFETVQEGYASVEAKPLYGRGPGYDADVYNVSIDKPEYFTISGPETTKIMPFAYNPPSRETGYTIKPKDGLAPGTYTANVVLYDALANKYTVRVSFTVGDIIDETVSVYSVATPYEGEKLNWDFSVESSKPYQKRYDSAGNSGAWIETDEKPVSHEDLMQKLVSLTNRGKIYFESSSNGTETFKAGKYYTFIAYLEAKENNTFAPESELNSVQLNAQKANIHYNSDTNVYIWYTFENVKQKVNVEITDVNSPRVSVQPDWTFTIQNNSVVKSALGEEFGSVLWIEHSSKPSSANNALEKYDSMSSKGLSETSPMYFQKGKYYTFAAWVSIADGYEIGSATVNGNSAWVVPVGSKSAYIIYSFPNPVSSGGSYTGIRLVPDYYEVVIKGTKKIVPVVFKNGVIVDEEIKWTSNDSAISVSDNTINVSKYGRAVITGISESGSNVDVWVQARFKDVRETGVDANGKATYSTGVNSTGYKAVYWAADKEITRGYSEDGTFRPGNNVTREEMVIFLWRLAGKPTFDNSVNIGFTDASSIGNETARKAIKWAIQNGITKGYSDGTFRPQNPVTREEICIFLYRLADYENRHDTNIGTITTFSDASDINSRTGRLAINWAVAEGIVKGFSSGENKGKFCPQMNCTRQQLAIMMMRYANEAY